MNDAKNFSRSSSAYNTAAAVEVIISGLRKKLGKDFIQTARNIGYRVEAA